MRYTILFFLILLIFCTLGGFLGGWFYNFSLDGVIEEEPLGGVRGATSTGFWVGGGEYISIASRTPAFDFTIYRETNFMSTTTPQTVASSTLFMAASGTPGACLILEDLDSAGYTYCNVLNGTMTCSTNNLCK